MGAIISAKCKCGFQTMMHLGGGMCNHLVSSSFPNYCKRCKTLFTANMYDEHIVCGNCNSYDTVTYSHPSVVKILDQYKLMDWRGGHENHGKLVLYPKNNLCPCCDNFSLKFTSVGRWD